MWGCVVFLRINWGRLIWAASEFGLAPTACESRAVGPVRRGISRWRRGRSTGRRAASPCAGLRRTETACPAGSGDGGLVQKLRDFVGSFGRAGGSSLNFQELEDSRCFFFPCEPRSSNCFMLFGVYQGTVVPQCLDPNLFASQKTHKAPQRKSGRFPLAGCSSRFRVQPYPFLP